LCRNEKVEVVARKRTQRERKRRMRAVSVEAVAAPSLGKSRLERTRSEIIKLVIPLCIFKQKKE
jgi:hypothetical protein